MACKSIVGKRIDEPRAPRPYDQHVVNLLKVEDIRNNPCLLEFATHKELVALISRYFGTVPILADMQIWWARPNDTIIGAKQFHFDQEDYTTIRLFLYINDVTSESGPLTYFDRNVSEQIKAAVPNWYVRISDKMLDDLSFMDQVNYLTGASGMIALVDPARLCHMGARVKVGDRLILMLHYVCFHSIKEPFSRTIETTLADSSLGSLPNSGLAKTLLHRSTETTRIRLKVDDEVSE